MPLGIKILLAGFLSCWVATGSSACSTPVFRYAMEHWNVDPYIVYLMHDGGQDAEVDKAEAFLDDYAERGALDTMRANLADPRVEAAVRRRGILPDGPLPRVVATLPRAYAEESVVVMDEALTLDGLKQLTDSPVRRELARRLISGESAVWLLLESGDREKDDAAERRIQMQLDQLAEELALPALKPEDLRLTEMGTGDLRIEFSILRFSREDPDERLLVNILLGSAPMLDPAAREPVAVPVFGRGRKLAALSGDQITENRIAEATSFITGSCSCEIKNANPGMDLLVPVDWDAYVDDLVGLDASVPPLPGYVQFVPATNEPAGAPIVARRQDAIMPPQTKPLLRNLVIVGGLVVVALGLLTRVVLSKP